MKPPFFPGNEANPFGICAVGTSFESTALSPHPGWEWTNEGGQGTLSKWGFVTTKVGG